MHCAIMAPSCKPMYLVDKASPNTVSSELKEELASELQTAKERLKTFWKDLLSAKKIICQLHDELLTVFDMLTVYYITWRSRPYSVIEHPHLFAKFMENEPELTLIDNFLINFEASLDTISESMSKYDNMLRTEMIELQRNHELLQNSEEIQGMKEIHAPSLQWIKNANLKSVDHAVEKWRQMEVTGRAEELLRQVQTIIHDA